MALESAIPQHLRQNRLCPSSLPSNYEPPFPAYVARFPEKTKDLAVAYLGAQDRAGDNATVKHAIAKILAFIDADSGSCKPAHYDLASVTDNTGAYNEVVIAYWPSRDNYLEWTRQSGFEEWFQGLDPDETSSLGWYREVFLPSIDRFETVFSDNVAPEGAAHMRAGVSGTIQEHVYWGSMRDRLPIAQVDALEGEAWKPDSDAAKGRAETLGKRVRVAPKRNLAIIRSGQDWSETLPEERTLYLDTMHPVLTKGMHFLRDEGEEVGCFSCRFMDVLPSATSPAVGPGGSTEKTFGLAYFDDLASLESWSKRHKTHLDIFGGFLQYAKKLDNNVSLRLFHEVQVIEPEQQIFEYINCHNTSGMLASF